MAVCQNVSRFVKSNTKENYADSFDLSSKKYDMDLDMRMYSRTVSQKVSLVDRTV